MSKTKLFLLKVLMLVLLLPAIVGTLLLLPFEILRKRVLLLQEHFTNSGSELMLKLSDSLLTEEALTNQLKHFDWFFEYSDDHRVYTQGRMAKTILEDNVFRFWQKDPVKALELWNLFAPRVGNWTVLPHAISTQQRKHSS